MTSGISVVVPIFNVEDYIHACLDSIARQSFKDLQVILVDDGSTDRSGEIAAEFARRDSRFQLIRKHNAGLGAARNTGVEQAEREFIAFLDSDDVLPVQAYESLHDSLARSGSDFATGVVRRFGRTSTNRSRLTPFRETIRATHVSRRPDELLLDRIATNKVWRRSFWDAHSLRFPEGVLYEDISVVLCAHVAAKSVDVLSDTVYWWRERDESITQDRALAHGIVHRMRAVRHVVAYMAEQGLDDLQSRYESVVLTDDMLLFVNAADQGDGHYRQTLVDHTRDLLSVTDPVVLDDIPALQRLKYHLLSRGMVEEMLDVLTFERTRLADARTVRRGLTRYGEYPFFGERRHAIPSEVYRLGPELQVNAALQGLDWERRRLKISGYAYIDRVEAKTPRNVAIHILVQHGDGTEHRVRATGRHDPAATRAAAQELHCYDGTGFSAVLAPDEIWPTPAPGAVVRIGVEVETQGIRRTTYEWGAPAGLRHHIERRRFRSGLTIQPSFDGGSLLVSTARVRALVESAAADGKILELQGTFRGKNGPEPVLVVRRRAGDAVHTAATKVTDRGDGRSARDLRATVDTRELAALIGLVDEPDAVEQRENGIPWRLRLRPGGSPLTPSKSFSEASSYVDGIEYQIQANRRGHVVLIERVPHPTVERLTCSQDGLLRLDGTFRKTNGDFFVVLRRRGTGEERRVTAALQDQAFIAELPLLEIAHLGGKGPLPAGVWDLFVAADKSSPEAMPILASGAILRQLPTLTAVAGRHCTVHAARHNRLAVEVRPAATLNRWENANRRTRTYTWRRLNPLRDVVVFDSSQGRGHGHDPYAIAVRLPRVDRPTGVFVADGVPSGVWPVVQPDTPQHAELLATARWIVTDDLLPAWWRPRRGQRVIQTWHGTPVKRVGMAMNAEAAAASRLWLAELRRQSQAWDVLLSPSDGASAVLQRSLGYEGSTATLGAPRLDALADTAERDARSKGVRAALGISADERVVLWAPTARHDGVTGRRPTMGVRFDIWEAPAVLGPAHRFLVRRHPAVRREFSPPPWVDVSEYPQLMDLVLIADVLVTDYSSLALDFMATGRPIVFYVPDIERFLERTGGLTIDLYADPPGAVTLTSGAALEAIRDAAITTHYAAAYDMLRRTYTGQPDGMAATRVIDRIFAGSDV